MIEIARQEAATFLAALPPGTAAAHVSEGDDEVVVEWLTPGRHVIVSFDGDGAFGYAMQHGSRYHPGAEDGCVGDQLPADLLAYLRESTP